MPYFESPEKFLEQMQIKSEEFSLAMLMLQHQLHKACEKGNWSEACSICELAHNLLPVERTLGKMDVTSSYIQGIFKVYEGVVKWAMDDELGETVKVFKEAAQYLEISEKAPYSTGLVLKVAGDLSVELAGRLHGGVSERKHYLEKAVESYQKSLHVIRKGLHVIQEDIDLSERSIEFKKKLMKAFEEAGRELRAEIASREHSGDLKLQVFPIMGLASASGDRFSLTADLGRQGYGAIDTVRIEGCLHDLRTTGGKASGNFRIRTPYHQYIISQIRGDSMDMVDIKDGDYVMLERPADGEYEPEEGDIVLANTSLGETLKEYHEESGDIWLEPRSSNESHKRLWIIRNGKEIHKRFKVVAKVVAVLKKIEVS